MKQLICLMLGLVSQGAMAAGVSVDNVWIRATVPGQQVAAAYMEINSPVSAVLIGAQSPAAGRVEMHAMRMDNGVMEMREIKSLDLPANKTVRLAPGGLHLMLLDLRQSFSAGQQVPIKLSFETARKQRQTIEVIARVRDMGGQMLH